MCAFILLQGVAVAPPATEPITTSEPQESQAAPLTEPLYSAIPLQPPCQSNTPQRPDIAPVSPSHPTPADGLRPSEEEAAPVTTEVGLWHNELHALFYSIYLSFASSLKEHAKTSTLSVSSEAMGSVSMRPKKCSSVFFDTLSHVLLTCSTKCQSQSCETLPIFMSVEDVGLLKTSSCWFTDSFKNGWDRESLQKHTFLNPFFMEKRLSSS